MARSLRALVACSIALATCPALAQPVDLVVVNGNVHTLDARNSRAEAVAVSAGRIIAVGSSADIAKLAGPATERIDAGGRTVLPGLFDTHVHVRNVGENLEKIRTNDLKQISELLERIRKLAAETPKGTWIQGASDWHESQLKENRFPTRWEIDAVAPDHPVFLRRGGHNVVVNTLAMQLAGIGETDKDPEGGHYDRDKEGRLTGWILERPAIEPIVARLPKVSDDAAQRHVERAMKALSEAGLTTIRAQHVLPDELAAWRALAKAGRSRVRGVMMMSIHPRRPHAEDIAMLEGLGLKMDQGDDMLRIGGVKITHDGGVEASMLVDDFANKAGFRGIPVTPLAKIVAMSEWACRTGWRLSVHALGDRAIKGVLDAWVKVDQGCPLAGRRWAIEHPYLVGASEINAMKQLGIVPHTQTSHNYTLGVGWVAYWGQVRANRSVPNRTYIKAGLNPAGGTDAPVTPYDPFLAMWGDVTRGTAAAGVLGPDEAVSPLESLKMHTIWAAYGLGMEDRAGSLEAGKLADLTIVSADPLAVPPDKIRDIRAEVTILGGKVVFRR